MRKITLALACLMLIFSTGCQPSEQTVPDNPLPSIAPHETERPTVTEPPLTFNANLLDIDFAELEKAAYEAVGTQKISLRPMYNKSPIDIFFLPSGEVVQFSACLRPLDKVIGGDYVLSEYQVNMNSTSNIERFDIRCIRSNLHFAKEYFDFNFDDLKNFTAWTGNVDFQTLLDEYIPGVPIGYRLVLGLIPSEIFDHPETSCVALDLSAETPREVNTDFLHRIPESPYLEFDIDARYCALLPYYSAEDMTGCQVPLSNLSDELPDYAAPDGNQYVLNNILLLFPEGPAAKS